MKEIKNSCEYCNDKGYIKSTTFGSSFIEDGTNVIEKCDECGVFKDDKEASMSAYSFDNIVTFPNKFGFQILA